MYKTDHIEERFHSGKKVFDHKGNIYNSVREMINDYGIDKGTYKFRKKKGWSLDKILTTPIKKSSPVVKDHLGNEYKTQSEMAKAWGIPAHVLSERLQYGMELEKALTMKKQERLPVKDYNGTEYPTFTAMCRAYGKHSSVVKRHLKNGKTLKEALSRIRTGVVPVTDHTGKDFPSITAMLEYWKIKPYTYKNRLKLGWSLEKILTVPVDTRTEAEECRKKYTGERKMMSSGLYAEITRYRTFRDITVLFEDGEEKETDCHTFIRGRVPHSKLKSTVGTYRYMGFTARYITSFPDKVLYECRCEICDKKDILTPQKMIEHSKSHVDIIG